MARVRERRGLEPDRSSWTTGTRAVAAGRDVPASPWSYFGRAPADFTWFTHPAGPVLEDINVPIILFNADCPTLEQDRVVECRMKYPRINVESVARNLNSAVDSLKVSRHCPPRSKRSTDVSDAGHDDDGVHRRTCTVCQRKYAAMFHHGRQPRCRACQVNAFWGLACSARPHHLQCVASRFAYATS